MREASIRTSLYELRQNKELGHIIETVDKNDGNRYTVVVSKWYNYPNW